MTISQSSFSLGSGRGRRWPALVRVLRRWQARRLARAELARLAQVGDYLLRDVGIDPALARRDLPAAADRFLRR